MALYQVTMQLMDGSTWTEEVWANYIDQAEIRAAEAVRAYGHRIRKFLSTKVIAR